MSKLKDYYSILVYRKSLILFVFFLSLLSIIMFSSSDIFSLTDSAVVINEIFPSKTNDEEWIEIYNSSASEALLTGFKIGDEETRGGGEGMYLFPEGAKIFGGDYQIIAKRAVVFKGKYGFDPDYEFVASDDAVPDMVRYKIWASGSFDLSSEDEVILLDGSDSIVEEVSVKNVDGGKSLAFDGSSWKETDPTPAAQNTFPADSIDQLTPQSLPAISFTAPSSAVAGKDFSVNVTFSNFEAGIYYLKVLIGKDGKFIYGNTEGASGWLAQNESWAKFPTIAISASGAGSGTVRAKVDSEVTAGNYAIKIRAHKDGDNYESLEKPLAVASAPVDSSSPSNGAETGAEESPILAEFPAEEGEALGAEAPQEKKFKLNFYIVVGTFGLIVGSGGLFLGFRYRENSSVAAR